MKNPNTFINHTVLVGLSYFDIREKLYKQEQFLAKITGVEKDCFSLTLSDGEKRILPIIFVHNAPRGEYKLLSTNEKVTNPDYLSAWLITDSDDEKLPPSWAPDSAPMQSPRAPRHWQFTYHHDPDYLAELLEKEGNEYLGKHVLVALTIHATGKNATQNSVELKQMYGEIVKVSQKGLTLKLSDGGEYVLPPDLSALEPAPPGEYKLKSTSEIITDPDLITHWSVDKNLD